MGKVAVISSPISGFNSGSAYAPGRVFELRDWVTDSIVFSDTISIWNGGQEHLQSGDVGWWFDFSAFATEGSYYVYDPTNEVGTGKIEISKQVYDQVLAASVKMYYYNRCGTPKPYQYADSNWVDATSFSNARQDKEARYIGDTSNVSLNRDLSGGWFDAGDYNKYVTFAEGALHDLLSAYEENPAAFSDDYNIPESGNGIPDIIDEIKWELDWMIKMNNADGSTIIKMGNINSSNNANSPPSSNKGTHFYGEVCSSSSFSLASVFAHAALVLKEFPSFLSYANDLEMRAVTSWGWAENLLSSGNAAVNCDDGTIKSGDADRTIEQQKSTAISGAIYLYALTGNSLYDTYVTSNYKEVDVFDANYWGVDGVQHSDALLLYTSLPSANQTVKTAILNSITAAVSNNWNGFWGFGQDDLYRAYMPDWSYHWGSSQTKAHYGVINFAAGTYRINSVNQASYYKKSEEQLHYFHGINPFNLVYLTNMYAFGAENSVNEIYHSWFADGTDWDNAKNSRYGPPPGYVTGGANPYWTVDQCCPNGCGGVANNALCNLTGQSPANQPLQKSYKDWNTNWPQNSWEITEPGIYYQAAYIRLLSKYADTTSTVNSVNQFSNSSPFNLYPNPTNETVYFNADFSGELILNDISGKVVGVELVNKGSNSIDVSQLNYGVYFLSLKTGNIIKKAKLIVSD